MSKEGAKNYLAHRLEHLGFEVSPERTESSGMKIQEPWSIRNFATDKSAFVDGLRIVYCPSVL